MVDPSEQLRRLPSVDEVLRKLEHLTAAYPRALVADAVRRALEEERQAILAGRGASEGGLEARVERSLERLAAPSLRRVINASGVILHTNLGRAPLPAWEPIAGYSNLEYDLEAGRRGRRDAHTADLLERLLGRPAIAVNNNAAAVYLALRELAAGGEVVVSRGELIEIGDGFRIPEIMAQSGALLCEVGTTNRTRIDDYREALGERTRLLLRVHPSNFRLEGFTARPDLKELVALGKERGILVCEDLGSGCLVDLRPFGFSEPLPQDSLRAGVDLISFSGDKLLGGPQAGVIVGQAELVATVARHPLARAMRADKMTLAALQTVALAYLDGDATRIPLWHMATTPIEVLQARAEAIVTSVPGVEVIDTEAVAGGGALPGLTIPSVGVSIETGAAGLASLRRAGIVARTEDDRIVCDLRTVAPNDDARLAAALAAL